LLHRAGGLRAVDGGKDRLLSVRQVAERLGGADELSGFMSARRPRRFVGRCPVGRVTEWLTEMRETRNPGPMARVHATRSQREAGWVFDVAEETELGELAARIATTCIPKGGRAHCELRAFDADGRIIGTLACKLDLLRIAARRSRSNARDCVDRSIGRAGTINSSMREGLRMLLESRNWMMQMIEELRKERDELRAEATTLRTLLGVTAETCPIASARKNGNER
jgi:hypothetical protein